MSATLSGSQAALKVLYPDGGIPLSIQKKFAVQDKMGKDTGFVGELAYVPIQNAAPQGVGATTTLAQTYEKQGNYLRFTLSRVKTYGVVRIDGDVLDAAVKQKGALVDLWDNETKCVLMTMMGELETHIFGNGTGVISTGTLSAVAAVTLTLSSANNMNYFELGMPIGAVDSATSLSPTVRSGAQVITSIDRLNRTITGASNWSTAIASLATSDFLIRAGNGAAGGVAKVITGLAAYVEGGSSPAALWSLTRTTDPVRLAGTAIDCTGLAMEDAVVDASARQGFFGIGDAQVLVANNIEIAAMKKSMGAKITYTRQGDGGSTKGVHSFSGLVIEGENGPIQVIASPFCPRNVAYLLRISDFDMFTLGKGPVLEERDGNKSRIKSDDDVFETRFRFYGNLRCKNPGPQCRLYNFGL